MRKPTPAGAAGTVALGGDLTVNRMGFGAMRITGRGIWGEPADRAEAVAVLRRAVDLGVDFIDTADAYGPAVSESIIAEALHPYNGVVIATKGGLLRDGPGRWSPDCSPQHLREACDASLKRLGVERIDLYQLHTVDRRVALEDSVGTLAELQRAGKIKNIGLSNVDARQLSRAEAIVDVVSVQNRYNLSDRASEGVLNECEARGIAFIPWYPLAMGNLTGRRSGIHSIAEKHETSSAQIALAWLLAKSPVMLPIPGTSSVAHLEENVAAARIELTDDEVDQITARTR
jgi:aryl-alcohol dehydrogenase-like predicted oxidoreductase